MAKRKKRRSKRRKSRRRIGSSGNTRTATRANTARNRTSTKTITAHVKVGRALKRRRSVGRKNRHWGMVYSHKRRVSGPKRRKSRRRRSGGMGAAQGAGVWTSAHNQIV